MTQIAIVFHSGYGHTKRVAETVAQSSFERDVSDKNRMNSRQIIRMIGNQMVLAAALEFLA